MRQSARRRRQVIPHRAATRPDRVVVLAVTALALLAGCSSDLGIRATEDVRGDAYGGQSRVDLAVADDSSAAGQALADRATDALAEVGGIVTGTTVTDSGVELTVEFHATTSSGGGLFVDEASRRLCVKLTVTPGADPPSEMVDADCVNKRPRGYRDVNL